VCGIGVGSIEASRGDRYDFGVLDFAPRRRPPPRPRLLLWYESIMTAINTSIWGTLFMRVEGAVSDQ